MNTLAAPNPRLLARLIPGVVAVILGGTLLSATLARLTGFGALPSPPPALATAYLSFTDLANGGVAVRDATSGTLIATIPDRGDGFVRMTLRLMAGVRMREHIGPAAPFILTQFSGGRMRLADPATGQSIELEAFGPSNIAEYAKFLPPETQK
jgi:putative photosynthetic complex assembly protein